jgi:cytochrome c biogenesis protein CcmG/thiol:disulfide interchange protein DsbE
VALLVYGVAAKNDDNRTLDDAVAHSQRPAAPDRRLPVLGGTGARSLADFRGRVVVLNFWASWCTPCIREAPHLERAQQRLAGKGTVLGVTFRDASPDSQAFLKRHHLTYPNVRDVDGKLGKAYGTKALPETFVVDKAGRLVAISRGEVSDRFLDAAIAKASRS